MDIETHNAILARFVERGDRWSNAPFAVGYKACATNRYALVALPKLTELPDLTPNVGQVYPLPHNGSVLYNVADIKATLEKIPVKDAMRTVDITCTECGGEGEVEWSYGRHTMDANCPECRGKGWTSKRTLPTGEKEYDTQHNIKVIDAHFRGERMAELLWLAEKVGVDTVTLVNFTMYNRPVVFVVGECELLLMPALSIEGNPVYELPAANS